MIPLFSKGTIASEIQQFANLDLTRQISIVQKLLAEHQQGLTADETRYEQTFNQQFFVELLGYEWSTNLHPKANTPVGGKIADGALGNFMDGVYDPESVQVVIELKGSKVSLDKKQHRTDTSSPVEQGFGYKTSFKQCKWLIVSNFETIRLYKDNKQEYEEWTLAQLADPKDGYFHLRKLLVLLQKNRLLGVHGAQSYTEKLLSHFRVEQKDITSKFYKQYKQLRLALINDLKTRNPQTDVLILVEKAQKIIDRIVFIHFCEDKGLLPADKLQENIMRAAEADFTAWEVLKKYFKGVDVGSEKLGIPQGYNGGLFAYDAVLDGLELGDQICKEFVGLGNYDFDDKLSVNILGHIFEQSISDLEQLKIDLLGTEVQTSELVESSKTSKRKKDGIFYTPEYIVDYIIQNSLVRMLEEKEEECLNQYKTSEVKAYQAYQQFLQQIKVLDPACGSGAFLVKVFDVLYGENTRVGKILASLGVTTLFDDAEMYKTILTNNIYGVDLNPESVEITKLSLRLKSAQKGKKLNNLDASIKCGNSLIDDPAVAGERAFDWNKEFGQIMKSGGFDVIVGNPPYVFGKSRISNEEKKYYQKFHTSEYQLDLYVLFIEKGILLLKNPNSILGYIIPNSFLTYKYMQKLREYLISNTIIDSIVSTKQCFKDAVVDTLILFLTLGNKKSYSVKIYEMLEDSQILLKNKIDIQSISKDVNKKINIFYTQENSDINLKIQKNSAFLGDISNVTMGIKIRPDFIFNVSLGEDYKPLLSGGDIEKYYINFSNKYILYTKEAEKKYPNQALRDEKIFLQKDKIILRQTADKIIASIDNLQYYSLQSTFVLNLKDENFLPKYILLLLNSKLIDFYYSNNFKREKSTFPQIRSYEIIKLPIKNIPLSAQQPFVEKADLMLNLNKQLHEKKDFVLRFLKSKFGLEKIPTKLEKFWELGFADFVKALNLKKLPLQEEAELMHYFDQQKKVLCDLKAQIDTADRQIDDMVFDLYGLSPDERRIVLDS